MYWVRFDHDKREAYWLFRVSQDKLPKRGRFFFVFFCRDQISFPFYLGLFSYLFSHSVRGFLISLRYTVVYRREHFLVFLLVNLLSVRLFHELFGGGSVSVARSIICLATFVMSTRISSFSMLSPGKGKNENSPMSESECGLR